MARSLWWLLPTVVWAGCTLKEHNSDALPKNNTARISRSRSQTVRAVLSQNVRVTMASAGETVRSASGVVLGVDKEGGKATTFVITNAHVVAKRPDLAKQETAIFVLVDGPKGSTNRFPARTVAVGSVPKVDLAVLAVPGIALPPARLAEDKEIAMGDELVVIAAPYGRALSVSGGLLSQIDFDPKNRAPTLIKTDAAIGYGASGGGMFHLETGKLIGIVEGYRTAKVSIPLAQETYSFDVPMPGETFAAPAAKIRRFLKENGLERLVSRSG